LLDQIEREILLPTLTGMMLDHSPYKGILYLGLMITDQGPKVVEYNCRFGDPECQPIVAALQSDLLSHMWATVNNSLDGEEIEIDDHYHSCVVMASEGYPGDYEKGKNIEGLDRVSDETLVFHAGTARNEKGDIVTDGGRVLSVVCSGETLKDSLDTTYHELKQINFENAYFRTDIGYKGLKHLGEFIS
jgi:phosphoribosylamine--glycine ligase